MTLLNMKRMHLFLMCAHLKAMKGVNEKAYQEFKNALKVWHQTKSEKDFHVAVIALKECNK